MQNNIFRSLTPYQYVVIAICFLCNMLDGMDVLIISYAAPAIAKAWSLSPQELGVIFSSGLIGMSVGAVFIAPFADKLGRKPMMLLAPFIMGVSIFLTSYASSINQLMILRFLSGIGIGIMMATTSFHCGRVFSKRIKRILGEFCSGRLSCRSCYNRIGIIFNY